MTPEARARQTIDALLMQAGRHVCSNMNKSKFEALGVPLPPKAEQFRIVAEVDQRLSLVHGLDREVDVNLKRAQAMRQSTLVRAFSFKGE
jgi:restriction endonuclease S subunit